MFCGGVADNLTGWARSSPSVHDWASGTTAATVRGRKASELQIHLEFLLVDSSTGHAIPLVLKVRRPFDVKSSRGTQLDPHQWALV